MNVPRQGGSILVSQLLLEFRELLDLDAQLHQEVIHIVNAAFPSQAFVGLFEEILLGHHLGSKGARGDTRGRRHEAHDTGHEEGKDGQAQVEHSFGFGFGLGLLFWLCVLCVCVCGG
jgi:hypothetical protein